MQGSAALSKLLRAAQEKNGQLVNLRAKCSLDVKACGKGERTLIRQIDHGEDDGAALRDDFARLHPLFLASEIPKV